MYPVAFDGILAILVLKQDSKLFSFMCCTATNRIPALELKQEQRMSVSVWELQRRNSSNTFSAIW